MQLSSSEGLPAHRDSGARARHDGVRQHPGRAAAPPSTQPASRRWWRVGRARPPGELPGEHDTIAAQPGWSNAKLLDLVFLLGLGGVFLANAAVALIEPRALTTLVTDSPLGALTGDATWIAPIITVNDALTGSAVIAAHRFQRLRLPVLAWAGVWLMIVTFLKATTIG